MTIAPSQPRAQPQPQSQPQPRLKLALFGLGRLGAIRARILTTQQPRIELVAVSDPKPGSAEWAADNLPSSVRYYADPVECMEQSGAEAVLVSTATATHAPLVLKALDMGLPIAVDLETTKEVVAKAKANPHLKFLVPFCRRFDESYQDLKRLVDAGELGETHAVQTDCLDQQDPSGFFVNFSAQSGGIFVDMGVHDIDIARYYLDVTSNLPPSSPHKQVARVFAVGQTAVYPALRRTSDADNGYALVEFSNGKILTFHLGRTLTNGFESATRVFGTKGSAIVNPTSARTRVERRDAHGVRTETCGDAFELYDRSFVNDLRAFGDSCLDGGDLPLTADDALEAARIATALQHSFRSGLPVYFDETGDPIMK